MKWPDRVDTRYWWGPHDVRHAMFGVSWSWGIGGTLGQPMADGVTYHNLFISVGFGFVVYTFWWR